MFGLFDKFASFLKNDTAAPVLVQRLEDRTLMSATVSAAPVAASQALVQVQVLASTTQKGPYTSALTVTPGEKIFYEVVAELAPVGTTCATTKTYKITSKTAHTAKTTLGYDGINSLEFNLAATGSFAGTFSNTALGLNPATGDNYTNGVGVMPGLATGATLQNVFAAQTPGEFAGATSAEVVLTGCFTVSGALAHGKTATIGGAVTMAGIAINSDATGRGTRIIISNNDAPKMVSFAGLTLTAR